MTLDPQKRTGIAFIALVVGNYLAIALSVVFALQISHQTFAQVLAGAALIISICLLVIEHRKAYLRVKASECTDLESAIGIAFEFKDEKSWDERAYWRFISPLIATIISAVLLFR